MIVLKKIFLPQSLIVHTKSWQSFSSNLGILQNSSCSLFCGVLSIVMLWTVRVIPSLSVLRTIYYLALSTNFHPRAESSLLSPLLSPHVLRG